MPLVASVLSPRENFGLGRVGAIGMIVRRLTQTMGWKSVVFGGRQGGVPFPDIDFRPTAPSLWTIGNGNVRYGAAVADALKKLKPDVIEVHGSPEVALAIADRLPSTPVVAFLHNDPHGMRGATTVAERINLLKRLACVVVPSAFLHDRLLDGIADPPKAPVIIPNSIDLTEFPPPRLKERLVLFVGRIVPDKAPDVFISAFAAASPHISGWIAEIIGADRFNENSPETPYFRTIQASAEGAGVRMLGFRQHRNVLAAMNRAAVVVMPSRWEEPFGLVALEAMASRAALICSSRGALREVAADAAIFVDPDSVPSVAAAIRQLCTNESRRVALAEAGRKRSMLFDLGNVTEQLADLRKSILA